MGMPTLSPRYIISLVFLSLSLSFWYNIYVYIYVYICKYKQVTERDGSGHVHLKRNATGHHHHLEDILGPHLPFLKRWGWSFHLTSDGDAYQLSMWCMCCMFHLSLYIYMTKQRGMGMDTSTAREIGRSTTTLKRYGVPTDPLSSKVEWSGVK